MALDANRKTKIQIMLVLSGILLVCVYFAGVFFFGQKQEEKRLAPTDIVTFSGLPEDTEIASELSMNGKVTSVPAQNNSLTLTPEQQIDFALPYQLKTTFQFPQGVYRDITWTIDGRGVEYSILTDGFSPDDKISLLLDDAPARTVPFDWSGRIELPVMLIVAKDTKACINIELQNNTLGFCHIITGKKAG